MISVAIDGPSGAGKSSLAKRLAKELGYVYVDTGAMYRAIGLYVVRAGLNPGDCQQVESVLNQIQIELRYQDGAQRVLLCGEDVSEAIRQEQVGMATSALAAYPSVRAFLLDLQRNMAKSHNVLMDGRDIGTVILPNATLKIFLTASATARAKRRLLELEQKGEQATFETVLKDIEQRDEQDMNRKEAPLRRAEDAVLVDTSDLDFEQSFTALRDLILQRVAQGQAKEE